MTSIGPLHDGHSHAGSKAATVGVMKKTPLNDSSVPIPKNPAPHIHQQKNNHYQRARKMQWWEIWEQDDHHRGLLPIDERTIIYDRYHYAADQFSRTRYWPHPSTNVRALWDQFRIFVGLLGVPQVWKKRGEESPDSDLSDDEDSAMKGPGRRVVARPPYNLYGRTPQIIDDDSEIEALQALSREEKEEKMFAFLDDPEKQVKVFLSGYMREQGFIWSDKNLFIMPKLVQTFLQFLLRHRVFSFESHITKGLQDARHIADLALVELPLTSKLSKVIPDGLSLAMKECWREEEKAEEDAEEAFKDAIRKEANAEIIDIQDVVPPVEPEEEGNEWDSGSPTTWDVPKPESLMTFLGPTTLPLTRRTSGLSDSSLRRITKIIPPSNPPSKAESDELNRMFTKVVLEPWREDVDANANAPAAIGRTIAMLATDASAEHMHVGMGIAGTWLQLVRLDDTDRKEEGYWYLVAFSMVLTSYHVSESSNVKEVRKPQDL